MKIEITKEALTGSLEKYLRPGAITALKKLRELQHMLILPADELNSDQSGLLQHEGIQTGSIGDESDGKIVFEPDTNELKFLTGDVTICTGKNWERLIKNYLYPVRSAEKSRKTGETDILVRLNLDGSGQSNIQTGIHFFDHMLDQIARHGLIDLEIMCDGDLEIDEHHTIEDTAIVLGQAIGDAIETDRKAGIQRHGFVLAMDEARSTVSIDLSNRPYLQWNVSFNREYIGDFPTEMAEHFFYTLAMNVKATLHVEATGKNEHHIIESVFKGFAKALRFAVTRNERIKNILPTTKGII